MASLMTDIQTGFLLDFLFIVGAKIYGNEIMNRSN